MRFAAQGSIATSPFAVRACATTACPPSTSTITEGSAVSTRSATRMRVSSRASMCTVRDAGGVAASAGRTVSVASTGVSATLAIITVSSARPSGVDVPSAQYHVVERASAAGTEGPAALVASTCAAACSDASRSRNTIAAATTATSASRMGHRRTRFAPRGCERGDGGRAEVLTPAPTRTPRPRPRRRASRAAHGARGDRASRPRA